MYIRGWCLRKRRRLDTTLDNLEAQSASNSGKTNASDTMAMALMMKSEIGKQIGKNADSKRNLNNFMMILMVI
jgi:hypothetical protein